MQAVIMAAGRSTRTHPLTLTRPKPLLCVANKPILQWQLESLPDAVTEVVLVVGYLQQMIRDRFGDAFGRLRLRYVEQLDPCGTGDAVLRCASHVTGNFLALNGDDLYDPADLSKLVEQPRTALARETADPRMFGVYEVGERGQVLHLVEKPEKPASNLVNIGAYHLPREIIEVLRGTSPSPRGEVELTSAIQTLAGQADFFVIRSVGYWLPIGYPWHLLDANQHLLKATTKDARHGDISALTDIRGPVAIGEGARIHAGVTIVGPVLIGRDCELGPNCYIRPYTTLGDRCKVGAGCEVKNSILMDGAHVPHLSYVGDSVVGERTNFGAGTITANFRHDGKNIQSRVKGELIDSGRRKLGAIIGDDVHLGINTSIYPGRKLWPGTSTLPGEVVRRDVEK